MRIVLTAVAVLAALPASAAYIEGDTAFGCRVLDDQKRIDRAAGAGDQAGAAAIVRQLAASGRCAPLIEGARVRIEENSFPYACVTSFGSADACVWVRQRNVNPRN